MKEFIITPKIKKSLMEITQWTYEDDNGTYTVEQELTWRYGRFSIFVPETEEEKSEWAALHSVDLSALENHQFLPDPDDEEVILDDYYAEMIDCDDGVGEEYALVKYPENADEDFVAEIEEGLATDAEDFLDENDWEDTDCYFKITDGVEINPA